MKNRQSHVLENHKGKGITLGRRISRILSPCSCYNPSKRILEKAKYTRAATGSIEDGNYKIKFDVPVLDQAWAYFEHQMLPRRFKGKDGYFIRAPPGETDRETHLYPLWSTTMEELGDFGDGVGLYFYTLQYFGIVALIAGIINIPTIWYFASNAYSGRRRQDWELFPRIVSKWILRGSAICTDTSWQLCPTCTVADWTEFPFTNDRLAYAFKRTASAVDCTISTRTFHNYDSFSSTNSTSKIEGIDLAFIKKNNCDLHGRFGLVSLASIGLLLIAVYYFIFTHNKRAIEFDEAEQTSTDYSVVIMNPPKDAYDPNLWKNFFESKFEGIHMSACTVTVNNKELVKTLVRRRKLLLQLQDMLPPEELYDDSNLEKRADKCLPVPKWKKWLCFAKDAKDLLNVIRKKDKLILKQSKKKYNVSKVFVTFETQHAQRKVLNNRGALRFKGTTLKFRRPKEPNDIRWDDISDSPFIQFAQRILTIVISLTLIAGGGIFIRYAQGENRQFLAALAITIINISSPIIVSILTSFESHSNETSYSTSRYLKLTLFRWLFTAVLPFSITPFTHTTQAGESLIETIYILFLFDLIRFPIVTLDIIGIFKRHVLGPRVTGNQRQMNLNFQGKSYDIGDRYTEVTRILFLAIFYGSVFPAAFFFAFIILEMMYFLDKYSLLRTWKQGPKIGAYISTFSTNFFLVIALTYTFMASYYHACFPFDNACDTEETKPSNYTGTYCAQVNNFDEVFNISITTEHKVMKFCDQQINYRSFLRLPYFQFEGEWMNESQELFSKFLGWISVGVLLLIGFTLFLKVAIGLLNKLLCREHQSHGEIMDDKFSDITDPGYVPKVDIPGYDFPFLLCNVDSINENLVGWRDPEKSYDLNNLIFDVPTVKSYVRTQRKKRRKSRQLCIKDTLEIVEVSMKGEVDKQEVVIDEPKVFSKIKEWPPVKKRNLYII